MTDVGDTVTIRWAGELRRAAVVRAYKNGRVKVEIIQTIAEQTAATGNSRHGTPAKPVRVTVEAWQIVTPVYTVTEADIVANRDWQDTLKDSIDPDAIAEIRERFKRP